MTVSRPELPLPDNRESRVRRPLSPNGNEGSPFVAPGRSPLALALHEPPFRLRPSRYAVAVMSPQTKPQSSRATATTAICGFFPRPTRRAYRLHRRV